MALISGSTGSGGGSLDGWVAAGQTLTFVSATTFTVTGDKTTTYTTGTRLKLTQTTPKYFVVVSSSFGAGVTTVTVTGGNDYTLANAAITFPFYSYEVNPQGYPEWFTFTTVATGYSSTTDTTGWFAVHGRLCIFGLFLSGTSNATTLTLTLPIASANAVNLIPIVGASNASAALVSGRIDVAAGLTTVSAFRDVGGTAWTASGTKSLQGTFIYRI